MPHRPPPVHVIGKSQFLRPFLLFLADNWMTVHVKVIFCWNADFSDALLGFLRTILETIGFRQSWTNSFGTLPFISVQYTFSDFKCLPPINVGHKLVHFQSCTLFLLHFPQKTLNKGEGVAKEPRMCENLRLSWNIKCCIVPMNLSMIEAILCSNSYPNGFLFLSSDQTTMGSFGSLLVQFLI